jgi:hypothetical protein
MRILQDPDQAATNRFLVDHPQNSTPTTAGSRMDAELCRS